MAKVKNKMPAEVQITAEQLLQEASALRPRQKVAADHLTRRMFVCVCCLRTTLGKILLSCPNGSNMLNGSKHSRNSREHALSMSVPDHLMAEGMPRWK